MTLQWTLQSLELAASAVAAGTPPSSAIEGVRPPLWGAPRKTAAVRALERWTPRTLRSAAALHQRSHLPHSRILPHLAAVTARDVLLRIVSQSSARGG
ncbi:MAG: hypothetical protein AcusKO_05380 [Acuticoccus sp.]